MTANNSHGSAHRCLLFLAHTAGVAKQTRTQFSHESEYLVFNDHNSTVFRQASGHIVMQRGSGAAGQRVRKGSAVSENREYGTEGML